MIVYRQPSGREREAALDLVAASFPNDRARQPEVRAAVLCDPSFAPAEAVVAVDDGEVVGYLATCATRVSLSGEALPVRLIGAVCTRRDRRRQGVGRGLLVAAACRADGAGALCLSPAQEAYVHDFYSGEGFVPAVRSRPVYELNARRLARVDRRPVRDATLADVGGLAAIYGAHYWPQTGAQERSRDWWERRVRRAPMLWSALIPRVRAVDGNGGVVAYSVCTDDDPLRLWEWAAAPGHALAALALLADEARQAGPHLGVQIAPHDPLWPALEPFRPRPTTPETGVLMWRAQDIDVLAPVLARVLAAAGAGLSERAGQAVVSVGRAELVADWSRLLALVYDGRTLPSWLDAAHVALEPDTPDTRAALVAVLPARASTRRITDAW